MSAAAKAVDMINAGEGDFLMKGLLSTDRYMRAILNKEKGLMDKGAILSTTVAEVPTYHKLLIFGDVLSSRCRIWHRRWRSPTI